MRDFAARPPWKPFLIVRVLAFAALCGKVGASSLRAAGDFFAGPIPAGVDTPAALLPALAAYGALGLVGLALLACAAVAAGAAAMAVLMRWRGRRAVLG